MISLNSLHVFSLVIRPKLNSRTKLVLLNLIRMKAALKFKPSYPININLILGVRSAAPVVDRCLVGDGVANQAPAWHVIVGGLAGLLCVTSGPPT